MADENFDEGLLSALTTEHFVLQTAASSTVSEAAARSSLYVLTLSSALIATGFTAESRDVFIPFVAAVFPAIFVLGLFTVVRLVDTTLENMQYLAGISRIRGYYRTLAPDAETYFSARYGRWPETGSAPSLQLGTFVAFLGTSASMIAFINNVVAGASVAVLIDESFGDLSVALTAGAVCAVGLTVLFLAFQRWRFGTLDLPVEPPSP